MTPQELATLYLEQTVAYREGVPAARTEPIALFVWEDLISDEPEQAWPVFEHVLNRISDDDMLEQVWCRLRLLLHRHYGAFHERAAQLLARFGRLSVIAGPDALDPDRYAEQPPLDRDALIDAYRAMLRTHDLSAEVDRFVQSDPERALPIALEIIHRGFARGCESFDVMSPLGDLLSNHGPRIVGQVEEEAARSVAVRRVLWRLKRQTFPPIEEEIRERLDPAMGHTTDYTELEAPVPPPQKQLDADERIIDGWFENKENFWAFSFLHDLVGEDPAQAWSITLDLIARCDDDEIGAVAAGPLEDLISKHTDLIWDDLTARVSTNPRLRQALRGVWIFEHDGEVYTRFRELMETIEQEPN